MGGSKVKNDRRNGVFSLRDIIEHHMCNLCMINRLNGWKLKPSTGLRHHFWLVSVCSRSARFAFVLHVFMTGTDSCFHADAAASCGSLNDPSSGARYNFL